MEGDALTAFQRSSTPAKQTSPLFQTSPRPSRAVCSAQLLQLQEQASTLMACTQSTGTAHRDGRPFSGSYVLPHPVYHGLLSTLPHLQRAVVLMRPAADGHAVVDAQASPSPPSWELAPKDIPSFCPPNNPRSSLGGAPTTRHRHRARPQAQTAGCEGFSTPAAPLKRIGRGQDIKYQHGHVQPWGQRLRLLRLGPSWPVFEAILKPARHEIGRSDESSAAWCRQDPCWRRAESRSSIRLGRDWLLRGPHHRWASTVPDACTPRAVPSPVSMAKSGRKTVSGLASRTWGV